MRHFQAGSIFYLTARILSLVESLGNQDRPVLKLKQIVGFLPFYDRHLYCFNWVTC